MALYWIEGVPAGRLGIASRPRGGDWLEMDVASLRSSGVNVLVSLLTNAEVAELVLENEPGFCAANSVEFFSLPIEDRSVPQTREEVRSLVAKVCHGLRAGKSIAIHCRAGIGRSALVAASVLVAGGVPVDKAFRLIRQARGCDVPDTEEQRDWVAGAVDALISIPR